MTETPNTLFGLRGHPWKPGYVYADTPLTSFYVPALERSVRYDRIAGFFSSTALSVAARGIASMITRGGRMRLLVGAQLSQRDVDALLRGVELRDALARQFRGLLTDPAALADHLVRRRLEALAWLAANDRLRIRVVVEADPQTGVPMVSDGYFHAKLGILHDETGDGIAFSGSINESKSAWTNNFESFKVFTSWEDDKYFQGEVETFERLWKDAEVGWRTVDLPDAAREELLMLTPSKRLSPIDPALGAEADSADNANWIAQFVRDAPYLVDNGRYVGVETAAVEPFPHQRAVAYDILSRFPCNHLLADEVGLGKTIEAGLILRSLLISGRAKRCLILVPRSLARQWQEELRDRFLIQAPFYDGRQYLWFDQPRDRSETIPSDASPWEHASVVIASAQMVKREERAKELLNAPPWDIVMVDEAHHARRREFGTRRYRPNRLLRLLESLASRTKSLILLTATPMQVNPVEVWDLLRLLGLPDEWSDPDRFIEYFQSTRLPYEDVNWEHVQPMLRASVGRWGWGDYLQPNGGGLGWVDAAKLGRAVESPSAHSIRTLDAEQRDRVMGLMRTRHPVAYGVHRHTRDLLRQYYKQGLITQHIPNRDPRSVWLEMSPDESKLYEDVERYISHYYNRYEEERPGLGFVMTIYRRRLTSGLYALGESLKRRRRFLLGHWQGEYPHGFHEEDIEDEDLTSDVSEAIQSPPVYSSEEVGEIERLLRKLDRLPSETKLERVLNAIDDELRRADQIIVFTQYTDTMDSLRDHLKPTYGSKLGCYSGRGGEQWDTANESWKGMSKERLQREFSEGRIKVLVCTDAAAEGLNLQNCGSMFNYDMPWNPMKVEQRIGRIDRIGQQRTEVRIRHFLYEDTVESNVYAALGTRIDWFEMVVGDLQPILQVVQKTIRRAAMTLGTERERHLQEGIHELRQGDNTAPSPLSGWEPAQNPPAPRAPLTLKDLSRLAWSNGPIRPGSEDGTFHVPNSQRLLTLDTSSAESDGVTLCTYNVEEFDRLMSLPAPRPRSNILRLESNGEQKTVGYYGWANGGWRRVTSLGELQSLLDAAPPNKAPDTAPTMRLFEEALQKGES